MRLDLAKRNPMTPSVFSTDKAVSAAVVLFFDSLASSFSRNGLDFLRKKIDCALITAKWLAVWFD